MQMIHSNLKVYSPDALAEAAAEYVAAELEGSLGRQEKTSFVLTGGTTPIPIYEKLASPGYRDCIGWNRIEFFWGDERCVPPQSPESNFGMAWTTLLSKLEIPQDRIHRIFGELNDPQTAAMQYEQEIKGVLPGHAIPNFDLVLLGMGEDGHTASLFPGTHWDEDRLVIANYAPKLNSNRISMTPKLINGARSIYFLVAGANKAEALARVLEEPKCDLPAARICPVHGKLLWMVDSEAASMIRNP
jgi:6-phosphogluconolactonase